MLRLRSITWLIALVAFIVPSLGTVSMAHAMQLAGQAAAVECPDHTPPPDCPAQGTAKHAAGQCCPFMSGVVAVMPPGPAAQEQVPLHGPPARPVLSLAGLLFTQDPPPPRA
jgi:hypothetical protein